MDVTKVGRYMSFLLRHRPQAAGLTLDQHGWADVEELIRGVEKAHPGFDRTQLEEIVATDSKGRFAFSPDKSKIRANQGHSIPVDVELEQLPPPGVLWHGTGEKYVSSIDRQGLLPQGRLYVHLSTDVATARQVGSRHGKPVIYQVLAQEMARDGHPFYRSANGVWLVKEVPLPYLQKREDLSDGETSL